MKHYIFMLIAILSVALVSGQVQQSPEYVEPVERQWDTGQCHTRMVEALHKATNPNDPLQEGYLRASEAYEKLSEAGQSCA